MPQDGKLEIEMETLAKPDAAAPDEKAAFISVILKEDTNLSIQYTYDTYGKEGMMLCCEAADTGNRRNEAQTHSFFISGTAIRRKLRGNMAKQRTYFRKGEKTYFM